MRNNLAGLLLIAALLIPTAAFGWVPQVTHPKTGKPLTWKNPLQIGYLLDRGGLGRLSNEEAQILVQEMMNIWSSVPTANVGFVFKGYLKEDVTAENIDKYFDATSCKGDSTLVQDGVSPIIFDSDGSILRKLYGASADKIAGITYLRCFTGTPSDPKNINQAMIILNGQFLDGINDESSVEDLDFNVYAGMILHELGHLLGIGHSEVNADIAEGVSRGEISEEYSKYIPVMYPLGLRRGRASTVLKPDDLAAVSSLYPKGDFVAESGLIQGELKEGMRPVGGRQVVARKEDDPLCEAIGSLSGSFCTPKVNGLGEVDFRGDICGDINSSGSFRIEGLSEGSYSIEVGARSPKLVASIDIQAGEEIWDFDVDVLRSAGESEILSWLKSDFGSVSGSPCRLDPVDYEAYLSDGGVSIEGAFEGDLSVEEGGVASGCSITAGARAEPWSIMLILLAGLGLAAYQRLFMPHS